MEIIIAIIRVFVEIVNNILIINKIKTIKFCKLNAFANDYQLICRHYLLQHLKAYQ